MLHFEKIPKLYFIFPIDLQQISGTKIVGSLFQCHVSKTALSIDKLISAASVAYREYHEKINTNSHINNTFFKSLFQLVHNVCCILCYFYSQCV